MKPVRLQDPARWRDLDVDAHALEARAAALADAARQAPPLGAQALSRIQEQVLERPAARRGFFDFLFDFRRLPFLAQVTVGLALVLVCAATADGAGVLWRRHLRMVRTAEPSAPTRAVQAPLQAPTRVPRPAASNDEPRLAPAPPLALDEVATHQPLRHASAPAQAIVPPAPPTPEPTPILAETPNTQQTKATEAGMVAEALSQLRQHGDPRAALAALDAYAKLFPHGVLEEEALRTRVEAVIQLDDRKAALALLDTMPSVSDAPGTDLLLTRAELRAAAGRFREALADFTQVVDGEGGAPATVASERALYGRAVCLGHLAEDDRARADLLAYERRFPSGRFATEVRRLLSEPAPAQRP